MATGTTKAVELLNICLRIRPKSCTTINNLRTKYNPDIPPSQWTKPELTSIPFHTRYLFTPTSRSTIVSAIKTAVSDRSPFPINLRYSHLGSFAEGVGATVYLGTKRRTQFGFGLSLIPSLAHLRRSWNGVEMTTEEFVKGRSDDATTVVLQPRLAMKTCGTKEGFKLQNELKEFTKLHSDMLVIVDGLYLQTCPVEGEDIWEAFPFANEEPGGE